MPAFQSIRRITILAAFGIGSILLLPSVGAATTLPDPEIDFSPSSDGFPTAFNHYTTSASDNGASGSIQLTPGPLIQATSSSTENAYVTLTYSFTINQVAGTPVSSVPFAVHYVENLVGTAGGNPTLGEFHASQGAAFSPFFFAVNSTNSSFYANDTYDSSSRGANANLNTPVDIQMTANAFGSSGSAMVDPMISIDPSFFTDNPSYTPSDFAITVNGGVGNSDGSSASTPTPEPASGVLLLAGLGLTAVFAGRRRARTTA